jgi:hypothetical protein
MTCTCIPHSRTKNCGKRSVFNLENGPAGTNRPFLVARPIFCGMSADLCHRIINQFRFLTPNLCKIKNRVLYHKYSRRNAYDKNLMI